MRVGLITKCNGDGEPLSIALVAEDGSYFYKVFDLGKLKAIEWDELHFLPYFLKNPLTGNADWDLIETKEVIQQQLQNFLTKYESVEIITPSTKDIKHLCDLMVLEAGHTIGTPQELKITIDTSIEDVCTRQHPYYDASGIMYATHQSA